MTQILVFSILSVVVFLLVKKYIPEYSALAEIFSVIAVLIAVIPKLLSLVNFSQDFFNAVGIENEYFSCLIKITGIALLTQFAVDICKDSGETALSNQAEFAGKIFILISAMPIFKAVMQTAMQFFNTGS